MASLPSIEVPLLQEVMHTEVVTCQQDAPLKELIHIMALRSISCVIVVNKKQEPIGVITERDLVKGLVAKGKRAQSMKVQELMNSPVRVVPVDSNLFDVVRLMQEKHVRRFPVMDAGKLVGIVTETDLVHSIIKYIKHLNWALVQGHVGKSHFNRLLREIKSVSKK